MKKIVSSQKKRLLTLEKTGQYVFHGSGIKLKKLEPRQAYTIINKQSVKDGGPGVFATPISEIAIFMAIINKKNFSDFNSAFLPNKGKPLFAVNKKTLDQINHSLYGYVHVFDKKYFIPQGTCEAFSSNFVVPIEVIKVFAIDLPNNISIVI